MFNTHILFLNRTVFRLLILTSIVNFSVVEIKPASLLAQNTTIELAASDREETLEKEVLAEINRARTDPQGYADWLEEQKQYYDGIFLELPGEKPLRSNKGLKAIQEAIDFLEKQEPLSPLDASEELIDSATAQLKNLANNSVEGNISYGRVTAEGIVMNLVVDDRFRDRRHRINLFAPDSNLAGIICQPDDRYQNVCAIAYENEEALEVATAENRETATETNEELNAEADSSAEVETLPEPPTIATNSEPTPEVTEDSDDDGEESEENENELDEESEDSDDEDEESEDDRESDDSDDEDEESEDDRESDDSDDEDEESEDDRESEDSDDEDEELEDDEESENSDDEDEESEDDRESDDSDDEDEESEDDEASEDDDEETIATNSSSSSLIEKIKRGSLEEGDNIIPEDNSFYDSYPLEGKAGDSFTISLESDEFDTFVAVMDAEGNIVDQNDDINDDNSNSRLRITLPNDGAYNIIVNAYDKGGTGKYVLTVRR